MSARRYITIALFLLIATPAARAQTPASRPVPCDSAARCADVRMGDCGMQQTGAMQRMGGMQQMGMMHRMEGMGGRGNMGGMGQDMPMPTTANNARLDSLVSAMHQARGDKKLAAMEKVIDELLAHHGMMQEHMRRRMNGGMGSAGGGKSCDSCSNPDSMDQSHDQ
jgi:hypothetical protein